MTESLITSHALATAVAGGLMLAATWKVYRRLGLSLAKYPSLAGHVRMAKRFARLIPQYVYSSDTWLALDRVDSIVVSRRRLAFSALVNDLSSKSPRTLAAMQAITPRISDLQFTGRYRVPFQFRNSDVEQLKIGSIWSASQGCWLTDLDNQRVIDVSGSYGVNLFGLDFYKSNIDTAVLGARALGPFLGGYHPCIEEVTAELLEISGQEEISFHMSGTEAVMQAVRLARYHSGKKRIVRFCGAYHGWWDDVQPGPGNPMPPSRHTLTLREMHANTLSYLRTAPDIACVLINPIQAMHPNRAAPTDSILIDGSRTINFDRSAYSHWLQQLRGVCTERGIALIMDEVFLGFRLATRGAQEYFGVDADLVTYGKTLGGGLPVGVLCGKARWMKRFNEQRPADICFARGTFNAHPYVLTAMHDFLRALKTPEIRTLYAELDPVWRVRRIQLNEKLANSNLPIRFEGMPTVWAMVFMLPGRYHWLLQFYLRREGIILSWVGTGRFIFNLAFSDTDFRAFEQRLIAAAEAFRRDGWWDLPPGLTGKSIKRSVFRELIAQRLKSA